MTKMRMTTPLQIQSRQTAQATQVKFQTTRLHRDPQTPRLLAKRRVERNRRRYPESMSSIHTHIYFTPLMAVYRRDICYEDWKKGNQGKAKKLFEGHWKSLSNDKKKVCRAVFLSYPTLISPSQAVLRPGEGTCKSLLSLLIGIIVLFHAL